MTQNIFATLIISLGFVGGANGADLCGAEKFQCNGFEPNWRFVTTSDSAGNPVVQFLDPENPGWETGPLSVRGLPWCVRR